MSITKGVFGPGPAKGSQKPETAPLREKVQALKAKGYLSQEVAHELKIGLGEVNRMWL